MSKLNGKAKALLDSCLSAESPESKAKIYKIIALSGLDATDPMFLVLALTGQLRVLLETAPADLSQLLTEWRQQSDQSIQKIEFVMERLAETQQSQAEIVRGNLEEVTEDYAEKIKRVGMATVSAISEANNETLKQASVAVLNTTQMNAEVVKLKESVEQSRMENTQAIRTLLERVNSPIQTLQTVTREVNKANSQIQSLQDNAMLITALRWFSPLLALALVGVCGVWSGVWLMGSKIDEPTEEFGRNLVLWNTEQIRDCRLDVKPKCTLWISQPPEKLDKQKPKK